jgi:hypothetical protein
MREFLIRRRRRASDKTLTERDAALADRAIALGERDAAVAERDAAVAERDAALDASEYSVTRATAALLSRLPCLMNFKNEWQSSTRRYYDAIEQSGISSDSVAGMYAAAGLNDYYTRDHWRRFHELFAYLAARFSQFPRTPEFLEIGTSAHTTPFYRNFLDCRYDTICRPVGLGGPSCEWAANAGSRNHWQIDLNSPERHVASVEQVSARSYEAAICCEVIEHLTRPPRDLIKFAISALKQDGILYLTTPNFLTLHKVESIFKGTSPVPGFEDYRDNYHAHHHFREYTIPELVSEVSYAGGTVKEVALSNCWDHPKYLDIDEAMFRSCIVLIITRGA